ncbi:aminopeptidase P family N-terminal domain-containing protein [Streptomyces sp. 8L]|uniref:aminopeptidase P family N-terminal domain-containing protein n=1 Tax=Streptomyces sp. 8L TaxID=2877242 RepID=UPI001CD696DC|nr:aminopeptidase P family N-terminal domain-containing protein [Streptomyces sp. 8L]MCA1218718.1 aminopeptidase P family N-terminal domain-containing protein [Streptomyces sp. 8L]
MKRGLVVLDPAEVSESEWLGRTAGLRERLAREGVDVALVYGDVFASDDIAYLTNLCIYWNEGMLAVPAAGAAVGTEVPVFLTKLSPRVHPWMKRVSTVERIESGRSFGALVAKLLGASPAGTLGLIDAPLWPASVAEEVRAALPGWEVRELPGLVREQRAVVSRAELALLREGARVVARGAEQATAGGLDLYGRTATVERVVRGAGFLDVQVNTAQAPDDVTCVQVSGQFRTGWLHASRLAGSAAWTAPLGEALDAAVAAVAAGVTGDALSAAASDALARLPEGADAQVRWVNQGDLASGGEYCGHRGDEPLVPGSVVAVTVDVLFAAGGYAALADTVLVTPDGGERLTRTTGAREEAAK